MAEFSFEIVEAGRVQSPIKILTLADSRAGSGVASKLWR